MKYPILYYLGVDGLSMFGLAHDHIRYLTEQLPGAHKCRVYNFKYHHYDDQFWKVRPDTFTLEFLKITELDIITSLLINYISQTYINQQKIYVSVLYLILFPES